MTKLEDLQQLDQFCCSDYNSMIFDRKVDYQTTEIESIHSLYQEIGEKFQNFFIHTEFSLKELNQYSIFLETSLSRLKQLIDDVSQEEDSIKVSENHLFTDDQQQKLLEKVNQIVYSPNVVSQEILPQSIYTFSEQRFISLYEFMNQIIRMEPQKLSMNPYQQLVQDNFSQMMLAFQLVYHQIKFNSIYTDIPVIFKALQEAAEIFLQSYRRYTFKNLNLVSLLVKCCQDFQSFLQLSKVNEEKQMILIKKEDIIQRHFKSLMVFLTNLRELGY